MKHTIGILTILLLLCPVLQAKIPIWFEGAAALTLDDPNQLNIEGSVLLDLSQKLQIRAKLVNLDLLHDVSFSAGTRLGFDLLLHFPTRGKYALYGVGGFGLFTMKDYTSFSMDAGIGVQLSSYSKLKPFLEALVDIYTTSYSGTSSDNVALILRAGVRFR